MTEILRYRESAIQVDRGLQEVKMQTCQAQTDLVQRLDNVAEATSSIRGAITNIHSVGQQILAFLGTFPAEIRGILRKISQTDMQIYSLLLQVHKDIATKPTNLLQSNIKFEDALGRVRELPYEYFRNWEVSFHIHRILYMVIDKAQPFEGFLRADFKDVPGESKVLEGQYHIVDAKRPDNLISRQDWSQSVFPGAELSMSVIISLLKRQSGRCPRSKCSGVVVQEGLRAMTWYRPIRFAGNRLF
jgi:hypothetical protein